MQDSDSMTMIGKITSAFGEWKEESLRILSTDGEGIPPHDPTNEIWKARISSMR